MPFYPTDIPGLLIFEPKVLDDNRGHFFEAYNQEVFTAAGITQHFVQDNQSSSRYGVIRGLHYQVNPHAQSKLVRAIQGTILDVAVDIRRNSPTYGKVFSIELSAENKKQLFIPSGFAHGFSVLSETAVVLYKCDSLYNRESEGGIRFDDPFLKIDWKVESSKQIVSDKDLMLPAFDACKNNFEFTS